MATLSTEQEQLLERSRRMFDEFVSEMRPTLEDFGRAIWPDEPDLLVRDPAAGLPRMHELFADEDLSTIPKDELLTLKAQVMFYIASLVMQDYGGEWRIVEDPNSPLLGRYVLTGFSRGASPGAVIEPGAIMASFISSPAPRSLADAIFSATDRALSAR